ASFFDIFSAGVEFDIEESEIYSHFLVTLQQNFYSMAFERPDRPEDFYAPGVTKSDLAAQVYDGNPASYVSQVTYGRVFMLLIQSTDSEEAMDATLSANFLGLVEGSGEFHYLSQFHHYSIDAYAYGGDQADALAAIGGGLGTLSSFVHSLQSANDITQ